MDIDSYVCACRLDTAPDLYLSTDIQWAQHNVTATKRDCSVSRMLIVRKKNLFIMYHKGWVRLDFSILCCLHRF